MSGLNKKRLHLKDLVIFNETKFLKIKRHNESVEEMVKEKIIKLKNRKRVDDFFKHINKLNEYNEQHFIQSLLSPLILKKDGRRTAVVPDEVLTSVSLIEFQDVLEVIAGEFNLDKILKAEVKNGWKSDNLENAAYFVYCTGAGPETLSNNGGISPYSGLELCIPGEKGDFDPGQFSFYFHVPDDSDKSITDIVETAKNSIIAGKQGFCSDGYMYLVKIPAKTLYLAQEGQLEVTGEIGFSDFIPFECIEKLYQLAGNKPVLKYEANIINTADNDKNAENVTKVKSLIDFNENFRNKQLLKKKDGLDTDNGYTITREQLIQLKRFSLRNQNVTIDGDCLIRSVIYTGATCMEEQELRDFIANRIKNDIELQIQLQILSNDSLEVIDSQIRQCRNYFGLTGNSMALWIAYALGIRLNIINENGTITTIGTGTSFYLLKFYGLLPHYHAAVVVDPVIN